MMLDKSQINEWDGEPEANANSDKSAMNDKSASPQSPAEKFFLDVHQRQLLHREGVPTGETVTLTPEQAKARKGRGQWLALGLFAFVILVFVLTMTKMGAQILVRDL